MPDPDRTTPHDDRADDQVGLYEQIYGRPPVDPHDDHADTDEGLYEQIYGRPPVDPQQNGDVR